MCVEEATLVDAKEQGFKKSIEINTQRIEQKLDKERKEIIHNLREKSIPDCEIAVIMNISIEEINSLSAINSAIDIKEAVELYVKYGKVQAIIDAEYLNALCQIEKYILLDAYVQGLLQGSQITKLSHNDYWRMTIIDLQSKGLEKYEIEWIVNLYSNELN